MLLVDHHPSRATQCSTPIWRSTSSRRPQRTTTNCRTTSTLPSPPRRCTACIPSDAWRSQICLRPTRSSTARVRSGRSTCAPPTMAMVSFCTTPSPATLSSRACGTSTSGHSRGRPLSRACRAPATFTNPLTGPLCTSLSALCSTRRHPPPPRSTPRSPPPLQSSRPPRPWPRSPRSPPPPPSPRPA